VRQTHPDLGYRWRLHLTRKDPESRDWLILHYDYLISRTRNRMGLNPPPSGIEAEDLEQHARLVGLIKRGVDGYDPVRYPKVRPTTFLIAAIRGSMLEFLRAEDWAPRSVRAYQKQFSRLLDQVLRETGQPHPTDSELARELGMTLDQFDVWREKGRPLSLVSADAPAYGSDEDDGQVSVAEQLPTSGDMLDEVLAADQATRLEEEIRRLPRDQRRVMTLLYYYQLPPRQVAQRLGLREPLVNHLHNVAITTLQRRLRGDAEDVFDAPKPIITRKEAPRGSARSSSRMAAGRPRARRDHALDRGHQLCLGVG
jgi:RNA polymerase sigma factor FliA